MLKNILKLEGVQQLSKNEKKNVLGGKALPDQEKECVCNKLVYSISPLGYSYVSGIAPISPEPICCQTGA